MTGMGVALVVMILLILLGFATGLKRSILSSLWTATRFPSQANYSNDLCAMVVSDTKRIVDEITARGAVPPEVAVPVVPFVRELARRGMRVKRRRTKIRRS